LEVNKRKKVTMKDIASLLNISINAVSLALNDRVGVSEDTKVLIIKTASEIGYFDENPSYISKNTTKNICLMIESRFFTDVPFYSKVILGIENESKKNGYDIIVNFLNTEEFEIPACIENRKVSGILMVGTIKDEHVKIIKSYNIPIVMVDHASQLVSTDAILTQNISGAYMATQYLIDKGHRNIGFCGDIDASFSFKERWLGFYEGVREFNVNKTLNVEEISKFSVVGAIEQYVLQRNYSELAKLVSNLKVLPSAWVCSNDTTAICLYYALEILGLKVPVDASIIGFDDIDLCTVVRPQLTTIRVNRELMGEKAVKRLLWRINNGNEPYVKIGMEVSFIERESVRDISGLV
jgi:DNA-binding LacI/PurR family transcriptional regulator